MIRAIARWFISRAIDQRRPIPAWVLRRLKSDHDLQRFFESAQELAATLQADAEAWIDQSTVGTDQLRPVSSVLPVAGDFANGNARPQFWLPVTAAAILLAALIYPVLRCWNSAPPAATISRERSPSAAALPGPIADKNVPTNDAKVLLAAVHRTSQIVKSFKPAISDRGSAHLIDPLDQLDAARSLKRVVSDSTQTAGQARGKLVALLNNGLKDEQQALLRDLTNTYTYFSHTLPKRACRLFPAHSSHPQL